jgi:hypothetical protein
MDPFRIFVSQLAWFLCVWTAIACLVVWPWSLRLGLEQRLSLWVAPQMFRVLGAGLLVPNLAPGISQEFAVATALGDSLTATTALLAFIGLRRGWRSGRALAWACSVVGMADLLVAFPHAAATGAISHLAAQWYVPVFAGPIMVVSHAACLVTLLRARSGAGAA